MIDRPMRGGKVSIDALDVPEAWKQRAECIRDYFVSVRGASVFLGPEDAATLVHWFEGGVPLYKVLAGIERAAAARHARRVRAPLQLKHARRYIPKRNTTNAAIAAPIAASPPPQGAPHAMRLIASGLPRSKSDPARALEAALSADLLAMPSDDPEHLAEAALLRAARFFTDLWQALGDAGRTELVEAATDALGDLIDPDDDEIEPLLHEYARGQLRSRYPELAASRLRDAALQEVAS